MIRFLALVFAAAAGFGAPASAAGAPLPDAPGKQQVIDSCTRCHAVDVITAQPRSPDEWMEVVSIMVGNGVKLTDDEYDRIVTYLSEYLARLPAAHN